MSVLVLTTCSEYPVCAHLHYVMSCLPLLQQGLLRWAKLGRMLLSSLWCVMVIRHKRCELCALFFPANTCYWSFPQHSCSEVGSEGFGCADGFGRRLCAGRWLIMVLEVTFIGAKEHSFPCGKDVLRKLVWWEGIFRNEKTHLATGIRTLWRCGSFFRWQLLFSVSRWKEGKKRKLCRALFSWKFSFSLKTPQQLQSAMVPHRPW